MKKIKFLLVVLAVLVFQSFNSQGADLEEISNYYGSAFVNLDYLDNTLVKKLPGIMEAQIEKSYEYFNQGDYDNAINSLNTVFIFLNRFEDRYARLYLEPKQISPLFSIRKFLGIISRELAEL